MADQPEHRLQQSIHSWVSHCVIEDHEFLGFDRGRKHSDQEHINQANRGIRSGTADTLLVLMHRPDIWCELKWGKNTPTDLQKLFGADMIRLGKSWFWTASVAGYCKALRGYGVMLSRNAETLAEDFDLKLLARRMRAKGDVVAKPMRARPSRQAVARGNAFSLGMGRR